MPTDYARKANTRPGNGGLPGWVWFLTGLASGVFAAFLFYLWHSVPTDPNATAVLSKPGAEIAAPGKKSDAMKWDFYDMFPKSEVPVVEAYDKEGKKTIAEAPKHFLIQAGAFKTEDEADQQRAKLILLGLEPFIKTSARDGVTWYRVMLGPIDSSLEVDRKRRKLAEANIASLTFSVSP